MEQILNKLSEIETTARRIMEDADPDKGSSFLRNGTAMQRFRCSPGAENKSENTGTSQQS